MNSSSSSASESPPPDEDDASDSGGESLGDSFRQARREMWVMVSAWVFFFLWVTLVCARMAFVDPGEAVPTLFGMPRWVAIGIAVPWIAANGFIIWFALRFMKDTPLPDSNITGSNKS